VRAIFITAGGLCLGVTVVERLSAPAAGSRLGGAANFNDMARPHFKQRGHGVHILSSSLPGKGHWLNPIEPKRLHVYSRELVLCSLAG
jgi:hypothetical protein